MLPSLMPRSVVLARLHAAAHPLARLSPYEAVVKALHVAAAAHPSGDRLDFYDVAATVIPVLFLGIAFQAKALEPGASPSGEWRKGALAIAATLVSFATVSSEAAALRVLALRHTTQDAVTLISACMGLLAFALLVTPVGELILEPLLEEIRGLPSFWVESGAFLILVLILGGAIALAVSLV